LWYRLKHGYAQELYKSSSLLGIGIFLWRHFAILFFRHKNSVFRIELQLARCRIVRLAMSERPNFVRLFI
jgi:hypothetical protein